MAGLPTMQVLLDDGSATYPYDITAYVRLVDGFSWSRGRPDEQSSVSPGTLSITLDNTDSRFTLDDPTYAITLDRGIRVKVNGANRWTGRVQSLPGSWPFGGQEFAVVNVTATDDLARAQRRVLRSSVEEEVLADAPTAYYTLGENQGATMGGDSSGSGLPSLTAAGTGAPVVFGNQTGAVDGLSAAQFVGGQHLETVGPSFFPTSGPFTAEVWMSTTAISSSSFSLYLTSATGTTAAFIGLDATGVPQMRAGTGTVFSSGAAVNDGKVHHLAVVYDGATTTTAYVDGVNVGSIASSSPATAGIDLNVGYFPTLSTPFVGTVSHVATYTTALSGGRILAHWTAGSTDYTGETPAARLARVAGYMSLATGTLDTAGATTMGPAVQGGRTVLDIIDECAQVTQGTAYLDGSGALTSRNGYTMTTDLTPDASLDATWLGEDTVVEVDMSSVVNYATGKAAGSDNVWTTQDGFSRGIHGVYRTDYEWNVATDAQAVDRTNWLVNTYGGSQPRFPTLTVDLLTLSGATLTNVLTLDVGKFLHVTGLPSQTPGGSIVDLIVLGITETVTTTQWTLTLNCARKDLTFAWVLGDAVRGVLGATTKVYF